MEKKKFRNPTILSLIKRESSVWDQKTTQPYQRLKFPLLTTVCVLNNWFTDKIRAFMNQYYWENVNKATEKCLPHLSKVQHKKAVCTAPKHFKLPNGLLKV